MYQTLPVNQSFLNESPLDDRDWSRTPSGAAFVDLLPLETGHSAGRSEPKRAEDAPDGDLALTMLCYSWSFSQGFPAQRLADDGARLLAKF